MADEKAVEGGRSTFRNQFFPSMESTVSRRAFGQVVLRLQAQFIRSSLETDIEEFEDSFEEILRTTSVFLTTTERVAHRPSLVIVNQESVVKTVCRLVASSNTILLFLDFQEQMTGIESGGDASLQKQVQGAQALVEQLLNALLLHKKAESYPGKESGLIYNEDVKVFGGFILHKYAHADPSDIPDPNDDNEDLRKLLRYWHTESLFHPLRHVPGTPWHKFFGNLKPGPIVSPALFRERKPMPLFNVIIPETIAWLEPEIISDYDKYRDLFERTNRLPRRPLPEYIRMALIRRIQRRLSTLFKGWKRFEDSKYLHFEDMSETPCPEYDLLGMSRLEALNAEINATDLAGIALLGAEITRVPVILTGEGRRYCLEFDGQWDLA